nr:TonB-dependent receptor [Acidiferrobacterales bacterium]
GLSTGFKASSVNLSRDSLPTSLDLAALQAAGIANPNTTAGTRFAEPEESTVLEIGLKARFDRGSFNMALFDQKIENFQSNIFNGRGFNLANAEEQSTTGLEFDLAYYPTDSLQFNIAGTFLDPTFDSFIGASVVDGVGDLSGEEPAGIHKTSLSIGATYNFIVGDNIDSYIRADYQYDDDIPTNDNVPSDVAREEFKVLNMSLGFTTANGLGFKIWGRNLTDHVTVTTGFPTPAGTGGYFGYLSAPRTYGVTVSKDF